MPTFIDMTGQRFGMLTVTKPLPPRKGKAVWECQCDCGNSTEAVAVRLRNSTKRSCGCLKRPNLKSTKICQICEREFFKDGRSTWSYWQRVKYCGQQCFGISITLKADARRPPIEDEFSKYFDKTDGCWEWRGLKDKDGYGLLSYGGVQYRAAKLALQLDGRPVGEGRVTCHTCDNPGCVRFDHLYPGTQKQNMADAIERKRLRTGEGVHSSKLTEDDIRAIRAATGTNAQVAKRFGVSPANVSIIQNRKTWKHVP